MRVLGFALVTASIALSAGGVAYRRPAQAQVVVAPAAGAEDQETCPAEPTPGGMRHARISAGEPAAGVISLNARGFNYSRPGDPVPTEVRPSGEAPAAPRD